ncbi:LCP family protein [Streptomyces laculatispora]|uniref:LCP family protein n=1 Tax=Streptomyces laculatispora TaxID=887464 RepID=UPI001A94F5CF|nr:LCP family protein [Streptomyces laculatispora]
MGRNSTPEEGTRPRVRHAGQLGWDDGLYEKGGTGTRAASGDPADDGGDSDTRHRRGKSANRAKKSRRRRVYRWTALTLAVLILGTAGAGYLYYQHLNSNIRSSERSSGDSGVKEAPPNSLGETPLNILLIGSDSRNSAANVKLGGSRDTVGDKPRADVQMLLHISADRKSASMVSIPRDTILHIPECKDSKTGEVFASSDNKPINESLQRGGPGCTLTTWEKLTGVYINHWMMIDFAGVVAMADSIGGVDVCVKTGVWDRPTRMVPGGSGLKLPAGTRPVKGEDALKWLRTRHAFGNDQNRARAQHMYMNSMLRTLKEQNVWSDAGRLMNLAETATKALRVSDEIGTVKKLFDLSMQLKNVPLNRITMTTIPTVEWSQDRDRLVPVEKSADTMWQMLRDDVAFDKNGKSGAKASASAKPTGPPASAPKTLGLSVVNGTGSGQAPVSGRARTVTETLQGKGFSQAAASQTTAPRKDTVVLYPQEDGEQGKSDALSVAKALGLPTTAVKADPQAGGLTVVIGADWRDGTAYKNPAAKAGDLPDGADDLNAADKDDCMDVYSVYRWDGES